jgi:sulfite reductase alpha subunit-like flavoprotein
MLQRYVDVTTPPSADLLSMFATYASDPAQARKLETLAKV